MRPFPLLVLGALVLLGACSPDLPSQPIAEDPLFPPDSTRTGGVVDATVILDDITDRILPRMADRELADRLGQSLEELATALRTADRARIRTSHTAAVLLLDHRLDADADPADAADRDAARLNLAAVDALIQASGQNATH